MNNYIILLYFDGLSVELFIQFDTVDIYIFTYLFVYLPTYLPTDRDSSVIIATHYGLDGPGIVSRWRRDFPYPSTLALGPTQSPIHWAPGLFPGGKPAGVALTTHPHIMPRLRKE